MGHYIENDTGSPKYVAGRLIPPFSGRHFEDEDLPPELRPQAVALVVDQGPSLDEQLVELLRGNVKAVTDALPGLTFEALERLASLESSDAGARKTLLQAIEAEKLRRADEQLNLEEQQRAAQALHDASDELLQAKVALINLPADSTERAAAEARVQEAQAKVDALQPPQA
jgi:signal transduction histidine kinase